MRLILLLLALCLPAMLQAQEQVDTLDVEVMPDLQRVVIEGPLTLTLGDTATYRWYGLSSMGDTVAIVGTLVSLTPHLEVIPGTGNTAQVVAVGVGMGRLTVGNIALAQGPPADSLRMAYLDGGFRWIPEDGFEMHVGDEVDFCAVVYFSDGSVGVGNTDECVLAYNSMIVRSQTPTSQLAWASKRHINGV